MEGGEAVTTETVVKCNWCYNEIEKPWEQYRIGTNWLRYKADLCAECAGLAVRLLDLFGIEYHLIGPISPGQDRPAEPGWIVCNAHPNAQVRELIEDEQSETKDRTN